MQSHLANDIKSSTFYGVAAALYKASTVKGMGHEGAKCLLALKLVGIQ